MMYEGWNKYFMMNMNIFVSYKTCIVLREGVPSKGVILGHCWKRSCLSALIKWINMKLTFGEQTDNTDRHQHRPQIHHEMNTVHFTPVSEKKTFSALNFSFHTLLFPNTKKDSRTEAVKRTRRCLPASFHAS